MTIKPFFFLLLVLPFSTYAAINCRVIGVADGDTFTCLTADKKQVRVRMNSIDAPEKSQAFGNQAKQALSHLIYGKTVELNVKGTDRYGRSLSDVLVNGKSINKSMVANGYAWAYRKYLLPSERAEYLNLEAQAKGNKRGLWIDPNPIYPSEYRHK